MRIVLQIPQTYSSLNRSQNFWDVQHFPILLCVSLPTRKSFSFGNLFASHQEEDKFSCLRLKLVLKTEAEFKFSDVYAAKFTDWGLVHESVLASAKGFGSGHSFEVTYTHYLNPLNLSFLSIKLFRELVTVSLILQMYRFMVHVIQKSNNHSSLWTPSHYSFGHENLEVCKVWVNQINNYLQMERSRPKNLLV